MFSSKSKSTNTISKTFFHDLVNHTHGIQLFLEHKISKGEEANVSELKMLFKELQFMQALIQDHFKLEHKNINHNYEYVPFDFLLQTINQMTKVYFDESVNFKVELKGKIAYYGKIEDRESCYVHFPSMYRVMNNIIKNIAEAKSHDVMAIFNYSDKKLEIEIKNSIFENLKSDNVLDKISRELKSKNFESGIGLESINEICNKLSGQFELEIVDNFWISKITIPVNENVDIKVAA